jgi:hypothetical protein
LKNFTTVLTLIWAMFFLLFGGVVQVSAEQKKTEQHVNADIDSLWALFQKSIPGEYCFIYNKEKGTNNAYVGNVIVTVGGKFLKIDVTGAIISGANVIWINDVLKGTRVENKIMATSTKFDKKIEFSIGDKTLTNFHFVAKREIAYLLGPCNK